MKRNNYFGRFCAIFATIGLTVLTAVAAAIIGNSPALAADDETPKYRMGMTPTFVEIGEMEPGKTYDGVFKVQNTGSESFNYEVNITPYSVSDGDYTIDDATETNYTQASKWITTTPSSGTIAAGEDVVINFTVTVPKDAPAGGQYALINVRMVQDTAASGDSSITAAKQLGFRVLGQVAGNTRVSGKVTEQKINSILFNPPITATSTVENSGNTHVRAQYVLQVFPLFGDEEVYTNEEHPQEITILPETSRYNSMTWDGAPHLGIFRVKQTITVADKAEDIEKIVFLCPIWLIFIILLLIFCAIFWVFSRVRGRN